MTTVLLIVLCVIVVGVLVWSAGGRDIAGTGRDVERERELEELREAMADRKPRYMRLGDDEEGER